MQLRTSCWQGDFDNQSKLSAFFKEITSGHLDEALSNTVLVIDGFTRFSAEEEALVALLNDKCHQIVVGTYTSQKAYKRPILFMAMFIKPQWIS